MENNVRSEKSRIINALGWKFCERIGVNGVQFILQVILARMLSPDHYGILSILLVFTSLATVFIQQGFNTSLIQNKEVSEEDYSSVFWASLIVASVMYIILFLSAPIIAGFYSAPEIKPLLRVLAIMLFPGTLNSVQLAKLNREMDFKKIFWGNFSGVVVSGIVGIIIAYLGFGIWALVIQNILNVTVSCLVMKFIIKHKIHFICNVQRVRLLFSFGWKLLVSSLIDTLYQDIRSLVVGKKYDADALGYYNRGKQFPQFIISVINSTVQSVMLPAMSSKQDDKDQVKTMMRNSITLSAYIIFPMVAGLAGVAEQIVCLLLTDKWLQCVPYMQIYCFTFAFHPVHTCNLQAINAMGRSDLYLRLEIIKKSYGLVLIAIAVFWFDTPLAIAMTGLISPLISCFVNASPNKKLVGYSYMEQMKDILPSFLMSGVMCVCVLFVGRIGIGLIATLVLQIISGVLIYMVLSIIFRPLPYRMCLLRIEEIMNRK